MGFEATVLGFEAIDLGFEAIDLGFKIRLGVCPPFEITGVFIER